MMNTIEIKKYGTFLVSRPEGRDAALVIKHQVLPLVNNDSIIIDFEGVNVMTPSWLDEVMQEIVLKFPKDKIVFKNILPGSVEESLKLVFENL